MQLIQEIDIPNKAVKVAAIKASLKATKEKRNNQIAKVYEVKIDKSHLNKAQLNHLNKIFLEAKWFYNYILSQDNVFEDKSLYKLKEVQIKVKDKFELRKLEWLSSQMKQEITDRVKDNIKGLSELKKNNRKIGNLKYKSKVNSIPLKQFGNTYKVLDNKYVKIQGIKKKLKVMGLKQIPNGVDIANGTLVKKHGDFYLKVTTYQNKINNSITLGNTNSSIGIDFGINKQLTLSNGISIQYSIPINNKLRRLYKQFNKKEKYSHNWYKVLTKIEKEFYKLNNIKKDIKNKIIKFLKDNYSIVCYQDESVKAWQHIYGRKILSTAIGGIISTLHSKVRTPVEIDKFYPSTKTCCKCGNIQKIDLLERIYVCRNTVCNNVMNRDLNAANNILNEGLKKLYEKVGMVYTDFKPMESETSTLISYLNKIPYVKASLVYETGSLIDKKPHGFSVR